MALLDSVTKFAILCILNIYVFHTEYLLNAFVICGLFFIQENAYRINTSTCQKLCLESLSGQTCYQDYLGNRAEHFLYFNNSRI